MNPPSRTARSDRRTFLAQTTAAAVLLAANPSISRAASRHPLHLSTNSYSWSVFYQREGRNFADTLDEGFADVRASGLDGYEPGAGNPDDIAKLIPLLRKHRLEMRSVYVGSSLHQSDQADSSIANILAIAKQAQTVGTRIIVTNPNPLQWGGTQNKDDQQLRTQALALNRLGKELDALGMVLAYHNHDIELRHAAREFHHMMNGTNPKYVSLCLDAHWIYRGSGNSQVALFDILGLYGNRVTEVHLRQSINGVWSETLGPGDIDYEAFAVQLLKHRSSHPKPHLVLEIAVENGTPKTLSPGEAHRKSVEFARRVFADYAAS